MGRPLQRARPRSPRARARVGPRRHLAARRAGRPLLAAAVAPGQLRGGLGPPPQRRRLRRPGPPRPDPERPRRRAALRRPGGPAPAPALGGARGAQRARRAGPVVDRQPQPRGRAPAARRAVGQPGHLPAAPAPGPARLEPADRRGLPARASLRPRGLPRLGRLTHLDRARRRRARRAAVHPHRPPDAGARCRGSGSRARRHR